MTSKRSPSTASRLTSVNAIRAAFLGYFEKTGHAIRPSSSLVPQGDNTLLFTNAGMVQFKNIFTGAEKPFAPRAATSQKCVRAGGKHNDLDNVGYTARHHTFFEMLGNFSFGDYFKELAIEHAWTLITRDYGLPKDRLLVTVYHDDDEAAGYWKKIAGLPDSRIIRIATHDNFWMMGDTGPCGPCSEIFYDHGDHIPGGPPGSPDQDGDRFIEIWNLVFMQFEQFNDGRPRIPLPKPSIDTGMGLERISAILQGVHSNYEIDLFANLIAAEEELYGVAARGEQLPSFRVIADHLRAASFLIADGVSPSNEGRGYVLRRIMRRAMRHAHILGAREPGMFRLVSALSQEMGEAYPELVRAKEAIESAFNLEEQSFQRTLGRGLALLEEETASLSRGDALAGDVAFKLYDTYGFPLDLTQDVLRARGMTVDEAGFSAAMDVQRARSQEHSRFAAGDSTAEMWFAVRDASGATSFQGYDAEETSGRLAIILAGGAQARDLKAGDKAELVFDQTPFYAESGGQAGDMGEIFFPGGRFRVSDVQKRAGDVFAHVGEMTSGRATLGDVAELKIDRVRRARIRANHSATHLLHAALRNRLGRHVTQKGSLVEADYFRFDFSHTAPMSREEIEAVEAEVNAVIRQNGEAQIRVMAPDRAIEAGAMALFGEKYGDEVRVLRLGNSLADAGAPYSVELCGGTHVARTGDIAVFVITSEGGVAQGVRRIEGATGAAALDFLKSRAAIAREIADQFKAPLSEVSARVASLVEQRRKLEAELADARRKLAMGGGGAASGPEEINGVKFIGKVVDVPARDLKGLADEAKTSIGSGVVVFVTSSEGKATVVVGVTDDLTARFPAGDLVTRAVQAVGGARGGGRPDMAQGGGPDGARAADAIAAVKSVLAG